jgi:hypothetical protein
MMDAQTVYLICAALGGTLFVCQFLMSLVGAGHTDVGHDIPHEWSHDGHTDHHDSTGSSWFFGVLTFRAVIAALTFFGLGGLAASASKTHGGISLAIAAACGFAAMLLVATLMRALQTLKDDGTVQIRNAVGKQGTVYLTIPGNKSGFGKVQLNLQNRTTELQAVTFQDQLPTGAKIVVVDVVGPDTVEVVSTNAVGSST